MTENITKYLYDERIMGIVNIIVLTVCFFLMIPSADSAFILFPWYVLLSIVSQILSMLLIVFWHKLGDGGERKASTLYIFAGALLYSFMYSVQAFVYYDIPEMKLFMMVPITIALLYRERQWARIQIAVQFIAFLVSIFINTDIMPYQISEVPPEVRVFIYIVASAQLMFPIILHDRIRKNAEHDIDTIRKKEQAQAMFANNLGEEFVKRIDDIEYRGKHIKENGENERVNHRADDIIKSCEDIREAVRATVIKTGIYGRESEVNANDNT